MSRTLSIDDLESLFITPLDINLEADAYADGSDDAEHSDDEDVIIDGRYLAYERYASLMGTTRPN